MKRQEALKLAATLTNDVLLQEKIANLLFEETSISKARKTMAEAFQDDPAFRHSYVANASVHIQTVARRRLAQPECDSVASRIVKLFFED
jgi:hypothetical protein